uniref:LysR substrate-binding domain-containing protein n=1 Tax=unclassified Colwellia TaxID=196834 RepID=UPI002870366E|nr:MULTISPECIES: LysR substrate-binding domain-containing protein [unclassified Colwellia]
MKYVLCASPKYLKLHGEPKSPEDLRRHKILKYGSPNQNGLISLTQDGKEQVVYLEPHFIANNGDFLKSLAESNHGTSYLPNFIVW